MAKHLTDHEFLLKHELSTSQLQRKTSPEYISILGHVLRAGGGWSGDLMIADYEDLQESEASETYVKRFQNQEVFVKGEHEFPCATGTLRLPNRPRTRPKGKKDRRFVVHEWRVFLSTS